MCSSYCKKDDIIHVALGLSDVSGTYSKYAATTILSLLEHTHDNVLIHILCDNTLSQDNRIILNETVAKYNTGIIYHEIMIPSSLKDLESIQHITIGTLFRLFIPEVCTTLDKIIYLDSDIIVQCDIRKLWEIDLKNNYLAAVIDTLNTREEYINTNMYQYLGVNHDTYFNAGVLVFNCKMIRNHFTLSSKGIEILKKYPFLPFADQDVLNILFTKDTLYLDPCFNYQIDISNLFEQPKEISSIHLPAILHFSGYQKPWNCYNPLIINFYFQYLIKTAFVKNQYDICSFMSFVSFNSYKKQDLKHILYSTTNQLNITIRILLFLKSILPSKSYQIMWEKIWNFRQKYRYDYKLYRLIKRMKDNGKIS